MSTEIEHATKADPVTEDNEEIRVDVTTVAGEEPQPLPEYDLEQGLTQAQIEKQRHIWGFNEIEEKKQTIWKRILKYFYSPISLLMELAAILAGLVQAWV